MSDKKKQIDQLFEVFESCFHQVAAETGFTFDRKAGPNIGRSLRQIDVLERGIFLELNTHWLEANSDNPEVVLAYCVRLKTPGTGFPVYVLRKTFFTGGIKSLDTTRVYSLLSAAVSEARTLTKEDVVQKGQMFEGFPKDGEVRVNDRQI